MLTRAQILEAQKLKTQTVPAPEWGGEVIVKELTSTERLELFDIIAAKSGGLTEREQNLLFGALFVCRTAVDDKGKRIFEDEDAETLMLKNEKTLTLVANASGKLNGIGTAEEIAGN